MKKKETFYADEIEFEELEFEGDAYPTYGAEYYQVVTYKGDKYEAIFDFSEIIDSIEDAGELKFVEKYFDRLERQRKEEHDDEWEMEI